MSVCRKPAFSLSGFQVDSLRSVRLICSHARVDCPRRTGHGASPEGERPYISAVGSVTQGEKAEVRGYLATDGTTAPIHRPPILFLDLKVNPRFLKTSFQ